jgi:hypothetical protein
MDGAKDPNVILKRGLGVSLGVVALGALALARPSGASVSSTHPPAGERILRALTHPAFREQHQVHDFACVALKVHLQHRGIPLTADDPNAFESLHRSCRNLIDWELNR